VSTYDPDQWLMVLESFINGGNVVNLSAFAWFDRAGPCRCWVVCLVSKGI